MLLRKPKKPARQARVASQTSQTARADRETEQTEPDRQDSQTDRDGRHPGGPGRPALVVWFIDRLGKEGDQRRDLSRRTWPPAGAPRAARSAASELQREIMIESVKN